MKTIMIADNHSVFRSTLRMVLRDYQVVGDAADCKTAIQLVKGLKPDLLLLDYSMGNKSGASIIPEVKKQSKGTKVLIITFSNDRVHVDKCLQAGADGYFLKDESLDSLKSAIACVLDGKRYLSATILEESLEPCH